MASALPIGWIFSAGLLSLRLAPAFAFAPPFSLTRVPALFRVLFGFGLAAAMVSGNPATLNIQDFSAGHLLVASLCEFALGLVFVLALQLMFGALYVAGRTLDIQAGFGLAGVINPATGEQAPLIGTVLVYAAGSVFFAMDGHVALLRIVQASLDAIPLGSAAPTISLVRLAGFITTIFAMAFGVAGGAVLCLLLTDMAIAMLSRTVPQMNVLILGIQVKTFLLLVVLPISLGAASALLVRMVAATLQTLPELF